VVRETLLTGGKILTYIAENKSPEVSPKYIVSNHVTESVSNLIGNLRGGGRKRARGVTSMTKKRKKAKRSRVIKGTSDLLQPLVIISDAEVTTFNSQFDIFTHRPIQTDVLGTMETVCNPLAPVQQND
jgi:hypothetical protein